MAQSSNEHLTRTEVQKKYIGPRRHNIDSTDHQNELYIIKKNYPNNINAKITRSLSGVTRNSAIFKKLIVLILCSVTNTKKVNVKVFEFSFGFGTKYIEITKQALQTESHLEMTQK